MFDLDRFRIFISLHTEQRKESGKKVNGFKNICLSLMNSLFFWSYGKGYAARCCSFCKNKGLCNVPLWGIQAQIPVLKPCHAVPVLAVAGCSETQAQPSLGAFPVLLSMLPCLFEVCLAPSSIRGTCINMFSCHVFFFFSPCSPPAALPPPLLALLRPSC